MDPPADINSVTWEAVGRCVENFENLKLEGDMDTLILEKLVVSVNELRTIEHGRKLPQILILAQIAAGLPVPYHQLRLALPPMPADGTVSTKRGGISERADSQIGDASVESQTAERHGQFSMYVLMSFPRT